uniref:Uncharacterized protein n=1 Tax=Medicago truncatula TaxID=3880 RepID=Q2HU00_MEDTR|nr:hypothetical protein MtrDRAFT_AC149577g7v1 [Medicago truncatula]
MLSLAALLNSRRVIFEKSAGRKQNVQGEEQNSEKNGYECSYQLLVHSSLS